MDVTPNKLHHDKKGIVAYFRFKFSRDTCVTRSSFSVGLTVNNWLIVVLYLDPPDLKLIFQLEVSGLWKNWVMFTEFSYHLFIFIISMNLFIILVCITRSKVLG
jgi:hypothetical protein